MDRHLFLVIHNMSLVVVNARNANEAHELTTCTEAPSNCEWSFARLNVELSEQEASASRLVWKGRL